jgi:hypothetical protein
MKEIHVKSQSHKNRTIQFGISEYPVFSEQIKSNYGLRFMLFRKKLSYST